MNKNVKVYNDVYGEIRKTNDYSKFSIMKGNRAIDKSKVKKLVKSMEVKQLVCPIIVNENYEIIDGQHRFTASRELGLPVYYIVEEGYDIEDVKRANLIATTWNNASFMNLYLSKDLPEYKYLAEIMKKYNITIVTAIKIKSVLHNEKQNAEMEKFKSGKLVISNKKMFEDFLNKLNLFNKYKENRNNNFIMAFLKLSTQPTYKHNIMAEQYISLLYKLDEPFDRSIAGYCDVLTNKIYSFRSGKNNKIFYDKANKVFYTR